MAIQDSRITDSEIQSVHISKEPDVLGGSARENKAKFDEYSDMIAEKHNKLVDVVEAMSPEALMIDENVLNAFYSDGMAR